MKCCIVKDYIIWENSWHRTVRYTHTRAWTCVHWTQAQSAIFTCGW